MLHSTFRELLLSSRHRGGRALMLLFGICFSLSTPISAQTQGGQWHEINDWLGAGFAQLSVALPNNQRKSFQAMVTDDPDGKQVVQFNYFNSRANYCTDGLRELSDVVIQVNGKRLKTKSGCMRMAMAHFITYFPETPEGRKYVVDSFKGGDRVTVRIAGYDLYFPTDGFSVAWDNFGGDAL